MENALPIFNYHGIEEREGEYAWLEAEKTYVLSSPTFKKQMQELAASGRSTLSLSQLNEWLGGRKSAGPVLLTFDDGHVSHFEHVAPSLKENHFTGIFFIPTALVGLKGQMSWAQLRELLQEGFEIGSHGLRHVPLTPLPPDELEEEMGRSKKILEDRLGVEVKSFSIPRGFYQSRMTEAARAAGYQFLFTSRFDWVHRGGNPLCLARLTLRRGFSLATFSRIVEGDLGLAKYSERLKEWTRRFVSPALYEGLAEVKRRMKVEV